jgi:hypothetical protein
VHSCCSVFFPPRFLLQNFLVVVQCQVSVSAVPTHCRGMKNLGRFLTTILPGQRLLGLLFLISNCQGIFNVHDNTHGRPISLSRDQGIYCQTPVCCRDLIGKQSIAARPCATWGFGMDKATPSCRKQRPDCRRRMHRTCLIELKTSVR